MRYWVGVDFGQASDYTAVSVVERVPVQVGEREVSRRVGLLSRRREMAPVLGHELHVRYLSRPPLRTSYEAIADGIVRRLADLEPTGTFGERGEIGLCVDATGVGRAVVDMLTKRLREAQRGPRVHFWPVVVTGGNRVTRNGPYLAVPKRDLINAGVIALQDKRLRIGRDVPGREGLTQELLDYRVKINVRSGHDSYEPWREGAHDDLLFAVCLACWAWSFVTDFPKTDERLGA